MAAAIYENMRTVGRIPRNMGAGTVWGGMFKIRNLIEAAVVIAIVYLLTKVLAMFLPYMPVLALRLILWLLLGLLAVKGVGGEPLSVYLLNILNYSNTRTYVTLQPPQRDADLQPPKKSRLEDLTNWMFTTGGKSEKPKKTKNEKPEKKRKKDKPKKDKPKKERPKKEKRRKEKPVKDKPGKEKRRRKK